MKKETLQFEPILDMRKGSYTALQIYPPGAWFGSKMFKVFVGGCGRTDHRTQAKAEEALLAAAIAKCDQRIRAAQSEIAHFEHEREKLVAHGLRPMKAKGTP